MTKKIFAMFLAVLMVVSMLPTSVFAASCPGKGATHTKSNCEYTEVAKVDPNCGKKGYTTYMCNDCDDTFVADFTDPVGEHVWKDADPVKETCEKNGSVGGQECTICGEVVNATTVDEIPAGLKCEWTEWAPANIDCTTGGKQTATCMHCGDVKEQEVPKAEGGHVMGAWELETAATAEATGLAVKKCLNANCGYTVEQIVFFDHDHDDTTLAYVAEVAAKCDETGVKAHYECRVCDQKFTYGKASTTATVETYNLVADADLIIKSLHDQLKGNLSCITTTLVCGTCNTVIQAESIDHKFETYTTVTPAYCTTDGYKTSTCTVCKTAVDTQIITKLGHIEGSWTVPATCVQYGYTYTYCLRQGCCDVKKSETVEIGDNDVVFDLTLGSSVLTEPVDGAGFVLNLYQANTQKTLYFTGDMSGYFFATSENAADAVKLYLETIKVEGVETAYRMYFYSGSTKNYIAVEQSGTHFNAVFGESYSDKYWTWNAEYGVLTTKVGNDDYYLGTYNYFNTISASKVSYLANPANSFATKMTVSNANGVALLKLTPNTTAGFDSTNHNWAVLSQVDPTCLADGVKISYCADGCGVDTKTETLTKVDHNWVADTTKGSDNDGVDEATCTTAGKKYFVCGFAGCSETKEEAVDALGHTLKKENDVVKVYTENGSHTDPKAYEYNWCTACNSRVNQTNYRAWADAGKIWETKEAAEAAHGTLTLANAGSVAGNCTTVGYTAYTCGDENCSEIVRVKIPGTGEHVFDTENGVVIDDIPYYSGYLAPTCTTDGYSINYKCTRCEKLIDEDVEENKLTVIPALDHTWTEFTAEEREDLGLGEYVKAPCGTPVYNNWIAYCSVCHPDGLESLDNAVLKADTKLVKEETVSGALCTATVYELYECHCGETHMRGYLVAGMNVDHEWIVDTSKTEIKATHTTTGTKYLVCKYCFETKEETLPLLPHKNAADEEFTDACNDPITDRHCVLCCGCGEKKNHDCTADQDANTDGVQPCDCVIGTEHDWSEKTYVDAICGDAPYTSEICSICYETKAVEATEYWTGYYDEGNKEMAPITGLGHRPVPADEEIYGQYAYDKDYEHPVYFWWNGDVHMIKVPYTAKYLKYTAPTYTTEGYAKYVCADCGQTIEEVLPAIAGLGFELEYENANGQEGITIGSVVNVTLYANGNNVDVNNFTLVARFPGMVFVGAEPANDNFNIKVTNTENTLEHSVMMIYANAVNSADKKQQNITIGEGTPIVTMTFIAVDEGKNVVGISGAAMALDAEREDEAIDCSFAKCEIEVKPFMDFNEDGSFSIIDLMQAEAILTGESEKVYDVSVDVDKDGEVTLYDMNLLYEFLVNFMFWGEEEEFEFICIGLSEEHVAVLRNYFEQIQNNGHAYECSNPYCTYSSDEAFAVCPACNRAQ